jgi:hypothetical protein
LVVFLIRCCGTFLQLRRFGGGIVVVVVVQCLGDCLTLVSFHQGFEESFVLPFAFMVGTWRLLLLFAGRHQQSHQRLFRAIAQSRASSALDGTHALLGLAWLGLSVDERDVLG